MPLPKHPLVSIFLLACYVLAAAIMLGAWETFCEWRKKRRLGRDYEGPLSGPEDYEP